MPFWQKKSARCSKSARVFLFSENTKLADYVQEQLADKPG
jgi:hypothetical protein